MNQLTSDSKQHLQGFARQMDPALQFRLQDLPAELRNTIYRYALVETVQIDVSPSGRVREPALLRTSKGIRRETLSIYYSENRFRYPIFAYDFTRIGKFRERMSSLAKAYKISIHTRRSSVTLEDEIPSWENLLRSLEADFQSYRNCGFIQPSLAGPGKKVTVLLTGAMSMLVVRMRGQPWEVVKALLEEFHCVLIAMDERWR